MPLPPNRPDRLNTCLWLMVPRAVARRAVRAMRASTSCSIRQLMANAAAANNQIPMVASNTRRGLGKPGLAKNMPITAQKTANWVTRGLVKTQYLRSNGLSGKESAAMASPMRVVMNSVQANDYGDANNNQRCRSSIMQYSYYKWPVQKNCG